MDPLTAALHDCAHRFMPHMTSNQVAASIKYGDSYYTILIGKQSPAFHKPNTTAAASFATATFSTASAASVSESVLGKRKHNNITFESSRDMPKSTYHRLNENPLYNEFGHNFKE
jgi:hypothetical protein